MEIHFQKRSTRFLVGRLHVRMKPVVQAGTLTRLSLNYLTYNIKPYWFLFIFNLLFLNSIIYDYVFPETKSESTLTCFTAAADLPVCLLQQSVEAVDIYV